MISETIYVKKKHTVNLYKITLSFKVLKQKYYYEIIH